MEIETKIISTEIIKPSSPTPKSLQKHHLSFLDQIMPPLLVPMVYFYSSNPKIPNSEKSKQLKKSLSETLSIYYPLAGRLIGNSHVDCNDAGAPFSEAEADGDLSPVVANRNPNNLKKILPYDEAKDLCMAVQATYFRCGGVAIAILVSHQLADALSFTVFANSWSALSRHGGVLDLPRPHFDAAAYFPPMAIPGIKLVEEEVELTIVRFSASKIAALRERYSTGAGGRRPSRVEAVSAFIWSVFASATGMRSDPDKICSLRSAVNIRTRANPPLSEYHFGNFIVAANARVTARDSGLEIIRKMREAGKAVNGEYVNWVKKGENFMKEMMAQAEVGGFSFGFSSICRLPLYEADFGWGKPVWVGFAGSPYKNVATFMDTKSGDGIEALIHLSKQDMEKFKAHFELQMLKSNL